MTFEYTFDRSGSAPKASARDGLPEVFCWSKFGDEAGETPAGIRSRKEKERVAGRGLFVWGIGTSLRPSILELLGLDPNPVVAFTPMKSPSAPQDRQPRALNVWTAGTDLFGNPYEVPRSSVVTSRYVTTRRVHYALICESMDPIDVDRTDRRSINPTGVRNLRQGSQVGSSQVTAIVRRSRSMAEGPYRVAFTARLVSPYFVRLEQGRTLDV